MYRYTVRRYAACPLYRCGSAVLAGGDGMGRGAVIGWEGGSAGEHGVVVRVVLWVRGGFRHGGGCVVGV